MTRLVRLANGLAALVLLASLAGGIPWALWHFVGWPLPHHVPSAAQVGRALNRQGIPDQALVDALAVVVWITWATLVASIAVEIPAALSGHHAPRLPLAGVFQPVTGRLAAAVIVACLSLAPRPAHGTPSGGDLGGLSSVTVRRAVPALVVHDAVLTSARLPTTAPVTAAAAASGAGPTAAPAPPAPSAPGPTTYVVQRGDTLWSIAERQLGDPLQWQAIYQLNEGRPQPGGEALTDPHWIDPGWTLLLPATATPLPDPTPPTAAATPPQAPAPTTPAPTDPPVTTPPPTTAPAVPAHSSAAGNHVAQHGDPTWEPVRLPSGSMVAGSFAAGVAATIAIGRLRRRHAYRYRPPQPGRTRASDPSRPTIHHLRQAATGDVPVDGAGPIPVMPVAEEDRIADPGRLDVASRRGEVVTIELTDLSGVAFDGPGIDDVARALVAALLVRAEPGAAEVLLTDDLAERLLPGLGPDRAVRRAATADRAARVVESERVARSRRFEAAGAADAGQFRAENPENPLPLLFVLLDALPAESLGRWAALVADAPRLAIAVVFLAPSPIATGQLSIDAGRRVLDAAPADRLAPLFGAQLFGLRGDEATVLAAVIEAAHEGDLDEDPFTTNATVIPLRAEDPSNGDPSKTPASRGPSRHRL